MSRLRFSFEKRDTVAAHPASDEDTCAPSEVRSFRARMGERAEKTRKALINIALFSFGFGSGFLLIKLAFA
jgi:hypothetical protein